jgi:hypothetical protein
MKKRLNIFLALCTIIILGSCTKNDLPVYTKAVVEFDAATWNANAAGRTYPVLTRVPGYNRPVSSTGSTPDPVLTRNSPGIKKFRVNLVGKQFENPVTLKYDLYTGDGGSTAEEGKHFKISRTLTIPANQSFGEMEVEILNPGAPPAGQTSVDILLILNSVEGIESSVNYRIIGLRVAQ